MDVERPPTKRDRTVDAEIRMSAAEVEKQRRDGDRDRKRVARSVAKAGRIADGTYRPPGRSPGSRKNVS